MSVWTETSTWTDPSAWFRLTSATSTGRIAEILRRMEQQKPYSYWEPGLWEMGLVNEFSPTREILRRIEQK